MNSDTLCSCQFSHSDIRTEIDGKKIHRHKKSILSNSPSVFTLLFFATIELFVYKNKQRYKISKINAHQITSKMVTFDENISKCYQCTLHGAQMRKSELFYLI